MMARSRCSFSTLIRYGRAAAAAAAGPGLRPVTVTVAAAIHNDFIPSRKDLKGSSVLPRPGPEPSPIQFKFQSR